ncbi:chloride channel protein [Haliea sp. E1-2-M8]|uniref:chloride channel protein n=1 Tax=Haliea sp. E1-2-M8 TaxID=3064706 RepID=UPI0027247351|nr:chloride channel protein [Haliea sp. E1-2-M8]MDO8861565.1 chloride channel protein [Haliea sp. E1-2-M8]
MSGKPADRWTARFSNRLSRGDALLQLALLGLLSGLLTGGVIVVFRAAIEWPLEYFLPGGDSEAFEQLGALARALLPLAGALGLGLFLYTLSVTDRRVGVAHVMHRLNYHQGYITLRSALIQFVAGVGTVVTGQSAGREGPAVHLGAACSSLMGQWMRLPNNSIRTLVACGVAGAISASFNTPIAGVIFAMEVVMMEYTIAVFTPVILAAVSAAVLSQTVYGAEPAFQVPLLTMNSLWELPWILVIAAVIGVAAAAFIHLIDRMSRFESRPVLLRLLVAGCLAVPFALLVPEVMGIGYDTVNQTFHGELGLWVLLLVGVAKLVLTGVTVGLGMPSSIIGPTLVTGATLGGAMGLVGAWYAPDTASSVGFYAMLGMGAMMGAVLQAPLAALLALLELTHNPNIILPGLLAITVASLVTSEIFGKKSVFLAILKTQGFNYQSSPVTQALRRVAVPAIMERSMQPVPRQLNREAVEQVLAAKPKWLLIEGSTSAVALMLTADLVRYQEEVAADNTSDGELLPDVIDLLEIPAKRRDVAPVPYQATLEEALHVFESTKAEALYVCQHFSYGSGRSIGIILQADIDSYYQYRAP